MNTSAREVNPTSSGRRRSVQPPSPSAEPHYSARMLAELWKLNIRTVRRIFNDAPGVIRVGSGKAGDRKRGYFTLRIPASVAEREHQRLAAGGSKDIAQ